MKYNNFWPAMIIIITVMVILVGGQPNSAIGGEEEFEGPPWAEAILTRLLPKRVFVTSEVYQGDLGGLKGADAKCQALADQAGLNGTFKAYLTTASASPATRFVHSQAHYMLIFRTSVVALNFSHLVDKSLELNHAITEDENGNNPGGGTRKVWTGTEWIGGLEPDRCQDWIIVHSSESGDMGDYAWTNGKWTNSEVIACDEYAHLYCFEQ